MQFIWQQWQPQWQNKLEANYDQILLETKMSREQLIKVIEVLQKYDVMPED